MRKKTLSFVFSSALLLSRFSLVTTENANAQNVFLQDSLSEDGNGCRAKRFCFGKNGEIGVEIECTGTVCTSKRGQVTTCDRNTSKCG